MSNLLMNISGKIDKRTVALYQSVSEKAFLLEIPFVVVGASARDIVLHYGYAAPIQRATKDIDFGIQVLNWETFRSLKRNLLESGFQYTKAEHRVISPLGVPVDIVPFGQLQDEKFSISWPPDGTEIMSVMGFQEASDNAVLVRIQNVPPVDIPVATPAGMAILKIISWSDRSADVRPKDAKDLGYLLSTYENIPDVKNQLYESESIMERYDWDLRLAGAYKLGLDAANIAESQTREEIVKILTGRQDRLVQEMCEHIDSDFQRNNMMTVAFLNGFLSRETIEH